MALGIKRLNLHIVRQIEVVGTNCYDVMTDARIINLDLRTQHDRHIKLTIQSVLDLKKQNWPRSR